MERGRGTLSSFFNSIRPKKSSESLSSLSFSGNWSKELKELINSWNGERDVPVGVFSAKDLIKATDKFDSRHIITKDSYYSIYRGFYEKRPILIKKYGEGSFWPSEDIESFGIRDATMALELRSHKNFLKLIGFCVEFEFPVMVYEHEGRIELLSHLLDERRGRGSVHNRPFSWKTRLSIAAEITDAIAHLHAAFSTPIIHRDLKPSNFVIDPSGGVAKLLDFSLSIPIPCGESQVEDRVVGTYGFAEPQYVATGILTVKTDVFGFGVILLQLLTGRRCLEPNGGAKRHLLVDLVKDCANRDRLNEVVDPEILEEEGGAEQEQQVRAFSELALRCAAGKREDRPEMMEVVEEFRRIQSWLELINSTVS